MTVGVWREEEVGMEAEELGSGGAPEEGVKPGANTPVATGVRPVGMDMRSKPMPEDGVFIDMDEASKLSPGRWDGRSSSARRTAWPASEIVGRELIRSLRSMAQVTTWVRVGSVFGSVLSEVAVRLGRGAAGAVVTTVAMDEGIGPAIEE